MRKIKLIILLALTNSYSFADCMFKIINYTDFPVSVKVGFYKGESQEFIAKPAMTSIRSIVNPDYVCNSANAAGMGVVFVQFIKDPDGAGAIYLPRSNMVKLKGDFTGSAFGRLMRSDDGQPIWLNTTDLAIDEETFQLKLNFIGRPSSFSAGTQ